MKTTTKNMIIIFLAAVISSLLFNSCSLIGFGAGSIADKKKPEIVRIDKDYVDTIELDKKVVVIKYNGDTINGRFNGMISDYNNEIQLAYDSIKSELSQQLIMPNINDTLIIIYYKDTIIKKVGLFKGFESGSLWCKYTYGNKYFRIGLKSIAKMVINNNYTIDSAQINSFIQEQNFPNFMKADIFVGKKKYEKIELASIDHVMIIDKRNRKFIGLGVGLALDVIIALIIADSNFHPGENLSLY